MNSNKFVKWARFSVAFAVQHLFVGDLDCLVSRNVVMFNKGGLICQKWNILCGNFSLNPGGLPRTGGQ